MDFTTQDDFTAEEYDKYARMVEKSIAERMARVVKFRAKKSLSPDAHLTMSITNKRWFSKLLDLNYRWFRGFKLTHTVKDIQTHEHVHTDSN